MHLRIKSPPVYSLALCSLLRIRYFLFLVHSAATQKHESALRVSVCARAPPHTAHVPRRRAPPPRWAAAGARIRSGFPCTT